MKILGLDIGYEEPYFYCGRWEFLLHDHGWLLAHRLIIRLEARWPTYKTFRLRYWRRST